MKRTTGLTDTDDDDLPPVRLPTRKTTLEPPPNAEKKQSSDDSFDAVQATTASSRPAAYASLPTPSTQQQYSDEKPSRTSFGSPGAVSVTSQRTSTSLDGNESNKHYDHSEHLVGAVPVDGRRGWPQHNHDLEDDNIGVMSKPTEISSAPHVVAQLAPDDDELAARVALQLKEQISSEWQARLQQEVQSHLHSVEAVTVAVEEPSTSGRKSHGSFDADDDDTICGCSSRIFYILLVCLLLVVGGVVGAVVAVMSGGGSDDKALSLSPTRSPTSSPTESSPTTSPTDASSVRRAYLLKTLGTWIAPNNAAEEWALLNDISTPQGQAIQWLSEDDKFSSDPEEIKDQVLLERYALAVLYFATSGALWWKDISFLDDSTSACEWNNGGDAGDVDTYGAYCIDSTNFGIVTFLDLHELGLRGSIPWEISLLGNLAYLYMESNALTGSLPTQLADMTDLVDVWLFSNSLSGQLPPFLPASLGMLYLTENFLTGTLPRDWYVDVPSLTDLRLGLNHINGTFPSEWGNFQYLNFWDMEGNELSGTIPTTIGMMTRLQYLYLEKNNLTGMLPTEIGNLVNLEYLYVYGNAELTGTVPHEFSNLDQLIQFSLEGTTLTGSLESVFCTADDSPPMMWADCLGDNAEIQCSCCEYCCLPDGSYCVDNEGTPVTPEPTASPTQTPTLSSPTFSPTVPPTTVVSARRSYLLDVMGSRLAPNDYPDEWAVFDDPSTPQAQALQWMSDEDDFLSEPSLFATQILLERYALAVLYFSTSGPDTWSSDVPFLDTSASVCSWHNDGQPGDADANGAYCDSDVVTYMDLHGLGLSGTIPWEITFLNSLYSLYMEDNALTGSLPTQFGALSQLIRFWAYSNTMTGQIPPNMPVPLEQLLLGDNLFSGILPNEWSGTTTNLASLRLAPNFIQGTIPPSWGNSFHDLYYWDMEGNEMTGTIPTTIGRMTSLQYLFLESNNLSGTLPSEIGNLGGLEYFFVYGNTALSGTIPVEFSGLTSLVTFSLEGTALTGSIDGVFCDLGTSPPTLWADCLGQNSEIECSCCSYCCDSEGSNCVEMT